MTIKAAARKLVARAYRDEGHLLEGVTVGDMEDLARAVKGRRFLKGAVEAAADDLVRRWDREKAISWERLKRLQKAVSSEAKP